MVWVGKLLNDAVGIVSQILGDVAFYGGQVEPTLDELQVLVLGHVSVDGIHRFFDVGHTLGPLIGVLRSDGERHKALRPLSFVLHETRLNSVAVVTEWVGWFVGRHGMLGWKLLVVLEVVVPVQHVLVQAWLAVRVVLNGVAVDTLDDGEVLERLLLFADGTALLNADWLTWIQRLHGLVG